MDEEMKAQFESLIPRGDMGGPEEIASAALFLASDDSSSVKGMQLVVVGGTTVIWRLAGARQRRAARRPISRPARVCSHIGFRVVAPTDLRKSQASSRDTGGACPPAPVRPLR
jgi:hypothetical protein